MPSPARHALIPLHNRAHHRFVLLSVLAIACLPAGCARVQEQQVDASSLLTNTKVVLTGAAVLGDWTTDAPGVRRRITPADMPKPFDTPSLDNGPRMVRRPDERPGKPAGHGCRRNRNRSGSRVWETVSC